MEQPSASLLSGILSLLGADYGKFLICEEIWRKISNKDKVYNDYVKEIFHFNEDSRKSIKSTILKSIGKSWRNTRSMLYHDYYDLTKILEQNIEECPPELDK
ncbi:hypothetical protein Ahy_A03g012820 [Arachis hypogaea]|uniref:Uncharacterized protein n=1 Tax=Arachis hypogaea TaxID=3818 RepID=A0A445DUB0_ARAHY|nr:hypothetical protein Ahy_A03g012820 [Arachis hypogaea]